MRETREMREMREMRDGRDGRDEVFGERFPFLAWEKSHLAGGRTSGLTN